MKDASLPVILSLIALALVYFPGGLLIFNASCRNKDVDHWDWLFSAMIPFYGIAEALIC